MPKKIYHYGVWTKDVVDVEIEANSKKEAEKKLDEMCNNDEIRWEKAYSVDGGHRLYYIERKEV